MGNVKYDLHVSLQPKIHNGSMAHYWNITQTNVDGTFTIADGWQHSVARAYDRAYQTAWKKGLVTI